MLAEKSLFVSIVAGKKIEYFLGKLNDKLKMIRIMPNLPLVIGKGTTILYANNQVTQGQCNIIAELFLSLGEIFWIKDEKYFDIITAISCSGPAYFFLFIIFLLF